MITRISLSALNEEDIIQYVSTTLCRPRDEILPLALVIQSKGPDKFSMYILRRTVNLVNMIVGKDKGSRRQFRMLSRRIVGMTRWVVVCVSHVIPGQLVGRIEGARS